MKRSIKHTKTIDDGFHAPFRLNDLFEIMYAAITPIIPKTRIHQRLAPPFMTLKYIYPSAEMKAAVR